MKHVDDGTLDTPRYQLLPPLLSVDIEHLKASIIEHGVQVAVIVDEEGEIIDGHHRAMIADSLGIEYPKDVRHGLNEDQKRLLAAELNVARRHLTDAQKVKLGRDIEPSIAREAKRRQEATRIKEGKPPGGGHVSTTGEKTRDEVASKVGLGSGRTYERGKQVLEHLAEEPDAPQLLSHIESGDWDLDDARKELRTRRQERVKEVAKVEQAESDRLFQIVGDPQGKIANARLLSAFSSIRHAICERLIPLDVSSVVAVLDEGDAELTRHFIRDTHVFLNALESAMNESRSIRIVPGKDVG